MYEVDQAASTLPFFVNDLFRHLYRRARLRVFLCGRAPKDERFDMRIQVKRLLERTMGCEGILGEDVADLREKPRADRDHLTLEVREAGRADLVIMFLGSPGTIAEVTAFAMSESINPKLVVFNDAKYKNIKSFINLGPLKLLSNDRVIHYDLERNPLSAELVRHIDKVVAEVWFSKLSPDDESLQDLCFPDYVALLVLCASHPIRTKDLSLLYPWNDRRRNEALKRLFEAGLADKQEGRYTLKKPIESIGFSASQIVDIGRVRMSLLGARLREEDAISDYRLLL